MRKISFKLLTQVQLETITTDVRTVGELNELIRNSELANKINLGGVKFIDKASYAEFGTIPEAVLPSTDCILFVTPIQTKSGAGITPENYTEFGENDVVDFINEMGYNEVRTFGSRLNALEDAGINLHGKRDEIVPRVIEHVGEVFGDLPEEDEWGDNKQMLIDAIELIEKVISNLVNSEEVAIGVTFQELEQEAQRLRELLNK